MPTLNSNKIGHLEQCNQLGILICSVGYKKKVKYKGHKFSSIDEMMKRGEER